MLRAIPLATAVALLASGCKTTEVALAGHAESLSAIMEARLEAPKAGVEEVREYLRANLPEVTSLLATLVVELDRLDGAQRAERAREVLAVVQPPMKALLSATARLAAKAAADEGARRALQDLEESYRPLGEVLGPAMAEMASGMPHEKNQAVKVFEDAQAAICGCRDMACVERAKAAFQEGVEALGDDVRGTESDKRAIEAAGKAIARCTIEIAMGAMGKDGPAEEAEAVDASGVDPATIDCERVCTKLYECARDAPGAPPEAAEQVRSGCRPGCEQARSVPAAAAAYAAQLECVDAPCGEGWARCVADRMKGRAGR